MPEEEKAPYRQKLEAFSSKVVALEADLAELEKQSRCSAWVAGCDRAVRRAASVRY